MKSLWAVKKNRGIEKALEAGQALLAFPNLEVVAANKEIAFMALQIIEEFDLIQEMHFTLQPRLWEKQVAWSQMTFILTG